jgi:CheY-like chemotaxis protein
MERPLLLIVEDEVLLHLFLEDALDGAGFSVLVESTANGALQALDREVARFAGIITDIRLGSKQTGWDVARHARELSPALPVVYMTADSSHE